MAPSDDDRSELLDDDALPTDYPPDRPLGVNQYGTTPQEERIDEPVQERVRRHVRDTDPPPDDPVLLLDETADANGVGGEGADLDAGETGDAILGERGDLTRRGDDTGPGLGPPAGDLASDRVPLSAEEAAVHEIDLEDQDEDGDEELAGGVEDIDAG